MKSEMSRNASEMKEPKKRMKPTKTLVNDSSSAYDVISEFK